MFKQLIQSKLEAYVRKFFAKNKNVKLIAVAGSVGKTSTKIAVAAVLKQKYRVRVEELNRNSELSVPTSILGIDFPDNELRNPIAWLRIFKKARHSIKKPRQPEIIIQEIGTEGIGDIPHFGTYLSPDLTIVSAITPEHMEFFHGSMDAVAKEELSVAKFSKSLLINLDDIDKKYIHKYLRSADVLYYGTDSSADFCFKQTSFSLKDGHSGEVIRHGNQVGIDIKMHLLGEHSIRPLIAASAVGEMFDVPSEKIREAVGNIRPLPGRMQLLKGKNGSYIIDDTFNSSPAALAGALKTFYEISANSRIVVLGSMKELGPISKEEHEKVAMLLDPKKIDELIVTHEDAVDYLAPVAEKRGLKVTILPDALAIGDYLKERLKNGQLLLFKSSYGDIWLEEAIKPLLANAADQKLLPRQFEPWLSRKKKTFSKN